jgi:hypothetical protein
LYIDINYHVQLADLLPSGTHVIWGVNLKSYNLSAAYLETKAIVQAFASSAMKSAGITLDFIEIGIIHYACVFVGDYP